MRISKILVKEGAEVRILGKFYNIMVQSVIFHKGSQDGQSGVSRVFAWYNNKLGST